MDVPENPQFPGPVSVFQDQRLPEVSIPVGYAALIEAYDLKAPIPLGLSAIGARHKVYQKDDWSIYTPRHKPNSTLEGHLVFALKYEGLDLVVLKRLFEILPSGSFEQIVSQKPTSIYLRRIWFLYEWLLSQKLKLPDAKTGAYVDIVDTKLQWAVKGKTSRRHRVRNNLPGTKFFCPLVRRTKKIECFIEAKLDDQASAIAGRVSADVLARTSAFLLLKDSKSSYIIEGESPPQDRIQRWGKAIGEAGRYPLDEKELLRLQRIVIGKERFSRLGFRCHGGFVGEHDRETRLPLPVHISARHEDIPELVRGLVDFDREFSGELNPVISAAVLAFGFVYLHPFEDGNGRIHRYLIHHVLSARGFSPSGIVFPVSSSILERLEEYRSVLETYSARLLPVVDWKPTEAMNVEVLNDTADFYSFFDATPHAEFLFECIQNTIEKDLPEETNFLKSYDQFKMKVEGVVEMPASTIDLLFTFLRQNNGTLSKRARENEFAELTEEEAEELQKIYRELFLCY